MELISRQAVLDGIDKYIEKAQSTGTKDDFISFEELVVKALPSAFEGMTNGEVMKAVFESDNVQFCETGNWIHIVFNGMDYSFCPVEFWDSPYKGVSK